LAKKSDLPSGWTQSPLEEIAIINPPKPNGVSDNLDVSFIPMKCVEELTGKIDLQNVKKYGDVKKGFTSFSDGDIIFAKITPCMENGKIAIVQGLTNKIGFGSTEFHVMRMRDQSISNKFYFYYLIQEDFRNKAQKTMKGTAGQLRVPSDYLNDVIVPLPPLNEQKRIVAKIEELFSRLDSIITHLAKTKHQLRLFEESFLYSVFLGEQTAKWRDHNPDVETGIQLFKKITGSEPKLTLDHSLPKSWVFSSLSDLGTWNGGGTPSTTNSAYWEGGTINWFSPKDIHDIELATSRDKITPMAIENSSAKLIDKNSILFVVRSGILRRFLPIALITQKSAVNQDLRALTPSKLLIPKYVLYAAISKRYDILKTCSKDGTTVESIDTTLLAQYQIPLCSMDEQNIIVNIIEKTLSEIYKINEFIYTFTIVCSLLKQSILKQAFAGNLVPQDPNDEPAEILLQKIKQQKQRTIIKTSKPRTTK